MTPLSQLMVLCAAGMVTAFLVSYHLIPKAESPVVIAVSMGAAWLLVAALWLVFTA